MNNAIVEAPAKDLARFGFKGESLMSKRRFAVEAIRKLFAKFNYNAELVKKLLDNLWVVEVSKIKPGYQGRYFDSPEDVIVSADYKVYAVTGEWTRETIDRLVKILKDTGFKIVVSEN